MAATRRKSSLLREVNAPASSSWRWKAITICTGASASTLQDIKVADSCGGFSYLDSGTPGSCVRNRFIYWRTYQDVLELVEESLDLTLSGNMVRYRFQDCPIMPQVSIHEVSGNVVVLVATVASVHRLIFPHPTKINRQQGFVLSEQHAISIFYDASLPDDPRNQFLLNPGGSITSHLLSASSCMCSDGHTLFAMATNAGGIQLIKLPPIGVDGVVIQNELSCSSLMKKLWSGLVPAVMKGQSVPETAVSIELLPLQGDVYIFTVCRDFRFRIWSSKQRECILVENLLDYNSDDLESTANPPILNVSGHVIKSVQGVQNAGVCVYLALNNTTRFMFLNPISEGGRLTMELIHTISRASNEDLVDFVVTDDYLVSLWSTQAGDHVVFAKQLYGGDSQQEWEPVHLVVPQEYVIVPGHRDARDVYLEKIFSPGFYSAQDILKALSVFKRTPTSNLEMESLCNVSSLKEQVINAVDTEIRNSALDGEMQEDVYTQLQNEQWERFFSCCHQYKQIGEKPKGLFADPVTGLFGVIKKSTFSVLRPCDKTEELYLSTSLNLSVSEIERSDFTLEDVTPVQFVDDIRLMCDCIQLVSSLIPPEASSIFLSSSQGLESPESIVEKLYEMISEDGSPRALTNCLQKMANPVVALDYLLYLTEMNADGGMDWEPEAERRGHHHFSGLFGGTLGVAFLCQSLQQMVTLRFNFIRDLLVVAKSLAAVLRKESDSSRAMLGMVTREIIPKGSNLLRCYKVLVWAADAVTSINLNSTIDFNLQQLTHLGIKDKLMQGSIKFNSQQGYLIQSFLEGSGGDQCRSLLSCQQEGDSRDVWRSNLCDMVHTLALLIWPATDDTVFPEFLIRSCQYLSLQHYVHLLTPWCTWNESSRSFFLALAYLHFNEPLKALKLFIKASDGVGTENFLSQKLLQTGEESHYRLQTLYYLKVMKQFEFYDLPDLVIVLAMEAINEASHDDPELATLQSEVFRQHLELGHNQLAFTAMMNNPDRELKKSSLRQFLAVLCERGHLSDMVSFDYKDLEEEVVYILEKKARSVDISTHDYYSLLFSFFIYREDYRKAGRVMFEKGLRLAQEVSGLASLQQQAQCYLFTLNSLRLVKPEYAWIIKPNLRQDGITTGGGRANTNVKRQVDGQGKWQKPTGKNQMEILELADLERQYLMLDARLRLIRRQPESSLQSGPMPSPMEMLSLLCSAGLYDVAVHVTKAFSLPADSVLSSLSLRCITLAISTNTNNKSLLKDSASVLTNSATSSWIWLKDNEVPPCGVKELSPADQAWALLQSYLTRLEDGSGLCHKCVAYTLLSQGFHLPTWLINSYKIVDVSSLLRVYLTFDLMMPASKLAMEYLQGLEDVLTGVDVPKFGLKKVIPTSQLSVWVPYTSLDQLLVALSEQDNPTYVIIYKKLKDKIQGYQSKVFSLSQQLTEA